MLARTSESLTDSGPTLVTIILEMGAWACAAVVPSSSRPAAEMPGSSRRQDCGINRPGEGSRFGRDIVVADFGCAFKPGDGLQKGKVHIAGRPVALFGNEKVDRNRFLLTAFIF